MDTTATAEAPEAPSVEVVSDEPSDTLTTADRCDKCNAQAYFKVELGTGDLLFCYHDYNSSAEKLAPVALNVTDESWKLFKNVKLDVSA